jgi:hypothetical protein
LIVQKYIQNQHNIENKVKDMITYLETILEESVKVLWEQWTESFPNYYAQLKRVGNNPYNFANIISSIIIGEDPELGYTVLQNERLKELEKLSLTNWKRIKNFLSIICTMPQLLNKVIIKELFKNILINCQTH